MKSSSGISGRLFTGVSIQREERIARFEECWFSGQRPLLEDYLPAMDDPLRKQLLVELVFVDLECRLTAGEAARVETYLKTFPEIEQEEDYVLDLLVHEHQIRQRRESVSLEEYANRFPKYAERMRAQLLQHSTVQLRRVEGTSFNCPHCNASFFGDAHDENEDITCPYCKGSVRVIAAPKLDDALNRIVTVGRFELLEIAGRGAFGTVWRARDTELDRHVAVKIPSSGRLLSEDDEDRFLREARSMAQLRHPGIVAVYESGRFEGVPYIVAEFIEGVPLSEAIAARRVSAHEAAELLRRIARALDYAHQHGVIHRDLKPSNIMLDRQLTQDSSKELEPLVAHVRLDYEPRVMDFGLALRETGEATVTVDGQIVGTAAYMSPEQARGESHHVDCSGDVYSAGVILYELLVGEPPFRGNLRMVLQQVLQDEPRPIRQFNDRVPRDLETICLKCVEKDPRSRYHSAGELADELERFLTGRPIVARPVGRAERIWRWCRRHPTVASLTATIVAVVTIGFAAVTWQWLATKRAEQGRTLAQVDALLAASPRAIPALLDGLAPYRDEAKPVLERKLADKRVDEQQRLRARMGLLANDVSQVEPLFKSLFHVDMETFLVLRQRLLACPVRLEDRLTGILSDGRQSPDRRFRAACFLAASPRAPQKMSNENADFLANQLIARVLANPSDYAVLRDALRPMAANIIGALGSAYRDANLTESSRRIATSILIDYTRNEPGILTDLVLDAEPWQLPMVLPAVRQQPHDGWIAPFQTFLQKPGSTSTDRDLLNRLAKQRANAAIALIELGAPAWNLLSENEEASTRSYFIDRFAVAGTSIDAIAGQIASQSDASLRRALILTLGGVPTGRMNSAQLADLKKVLLAIFRDDPDPGTHAAARWTLHQWDFGEAADAIEEDFAERGATGLAEKHWFANSQGQTMSVLGPAAFVMGSPPDEPGRYPEEQLRDVRIDRKFAIAMCETTIDQYRKFDSMWQAPAGDRDENVACPVYFVSWNQAAAYCNWLSDQEGIPRDQWCYVSETDILFKEAENCLALTGYRLPTEAEWEYACRAGTTTARFFGHSPDLLTQYAWCPANSPAGKKHPVGLKKPNDAGLFDVYGNVDEICHDRLRDPGKSGVANFVVTRGGAAGDLEPPRSALRNLAFSDPDNPNQGGLAMGFRVAKTIESSGDPTPGR